MDELKDIVQDIELSDLNVEDTLETSTGPKPFIPGGIDWSHASSGSTDPGHQHHREIALTDGATVALDASLGSVFYLSAGGSRTILTPTNHTIHRKIIIKHYASGGARTLTLTTGAGGFRFGSTVPALSETASGKTDYIGCIYNATDNRYDIVAVVKGY